jgi:multicomponent Na+:H+ antiporter subunit G
MWDSIVNITSWGLIIAGVFFVISGSLGMLRMPDFFTRIHPASVIDSFGAPLILLGVAVHFGFSFISGKIILLVLLLLITNPTATHVLAQTAIIGKLKPLLRDKK